MCGPWYRSLWLVVTCLMGAAVSLAGAHALAAETIRGIPFPLDIGDFRRTGVINNEPEHPGMGVTIRYSAGGPFATVFVYDLGRPRVTQGAEGHEVRAQALQAEHDIRTVRGAIEVLQPIAAATGPCQRFVRAKYRFMDRGTSTGQWMESHLYLGVAKGQFVKIRVSYPDDQARPVGEAAAVRFAEAVCELSSR